MAEQRKHRLLQIWTAIYQAIGIAAVLVGAIWFIAGWHSNVNTRLDAIEHHLDRIDIRLDRVLRSLDRAEKDRLSYRPGPATLRPTLRQQGKKKSPPRVP